jgi:arylsulfatase A-like enzyme
MQWAIPLLVIACFLASCQQPPATEASNELAQAWANRVERPNIVLIVVDTLRKDHLGCYGYDRQTSPNIDRLTDSSIVYENAFSQAPWTLPAMAALLTSRYPSDLGIQGFNKRIPDSEIFLPELLAAHGYATHAVVSHDFVGAKWGFDQGFDSFESFAGGHRTISSEKVTQAALRIVDRFDEGPTFLFVHYFDPHFLYIEHPDHRLSDPPPDAESEWWAMTFKKLRAQARAGKLSSEQRDYLLALYDSEIAFTDQQIGRLLDQLESTDRFADSIVIVTADHGEEFLDHGGLGHTSTTFNELINVPLIIKWPGIAEPVRSTRYVAHVDLLPTLLDYIGIPVDHDVAGMHLRERTSDAPIFSETRRYTKVLAVIKDGVKLVYDEHRDRVQFFDLQADPAEQQGLPELATGGQLVEELNAYRRRAAQGLAGVAQDDEIEITTEELEKLKALGYVD